MDRWQHMSGPDYKAQLALYFGMSSTVTTSIGVRTITLDDSLQDTMPQDQTNAELKFWWEMIAEVNPDRIATYHDFTYPSGVEMLVLRPGSALPNARQMDPPMPRPWLDLRLLEDRTQGGQPIEIVKVNYDDLAMRWGMRWAYYADGLYVTDRTTAVGPMSDLTLRLHYVPVPEPINFAMPTVRRDIPIDIGNAVAMGAALRCLKALKAENYGGLQQMYDAEKAVAIRAVTRTVNRPLFMQWTDIQLDENDYNG